MTRTLNRSEYRSHSRHGEVAAGKIAFGKAPVMRVMPAVNASMKADARRVGREVRRPLGRPAHVRSSRSSAAERRGLADYSIRRIVKRLSTRAPVRDRHSISTPNANGPEGPQPTTLQKTNPPPYAVTWTFSVWPASFCSPLKRTLYRPVPERVIVLLPPEVLVL